MNAIKKRLDKAKIGYTELVDLLPNDYSESTIQRDIKATTNILSIPVGRVKEYAAILNVSIDELVKKLK